MRCFIEQMNPADKPNLRDLRVSYDLDELVEAAAPASPFALFDGWLHDALTHGLPEPNAATLATVNADGAPTVRTVLLKAVDERGFQFFTNYESRKARELEADARGALLFLWADRHRQVGLRGVITKLPRADAESYFASRPYGHQIGAWVSQQSAVIPGREWLEAREAEIRAKFPEGTQVPCPPFWGGYALLPDEMEFWQGRVSRLHDRLLYKRQGDQWTISRLSP
jgi:pyridoxamine 5'-phosphate oxidase